VLRLAPDGAAAKAAAGLVKPGRWHGLGWDGRFVWGACQGSGQRAYQVCVELAEPAFRCTCPSRKFPCKHALGLLLLWSDGAVDTGEPPGWVQEWGAEREARAAKARQRAVSGPRTPDPKTAERRAQRVDDGIADLERWLRDQVVHGLAQAEKAPYRLWDEAARRLVDAQAPALAGQVKGLSGLRYGEGWPERMLTEYALLRLLTRAHQRRAGLPEPLRATVRNRIGFTVPQEEVLRGERVRDRWYVVGSYDNQLEQLTTRRTWLRGARTGRPALVLAFAPPGRPLDATLPPGATVDAELAFYPGAQPLRAIVAELHGPTPTSPPPGTTVEGLLTEYAEALARDPWLDRWPAVLTGVRLATAPGAAAGPKTLHILDDAGDALPLRFPTSDESRQDPWRLLAASGGARFTVAGEWTPHALRPLSAWHPEEGPIAL
jgi:SWIM zinc finger